MVSCPYYALGHLVLQIEDVAETTIKPVCPKMGPCGGIDELSRDAHSACRLAPFQHIAHPKLASTSWHSSLPEIGDPFCADIHLPDCRRRNRQHNDGGGASFSKDRCVRTSL